jgi:hypothetical protein
MELPQVRGMEGVMKRFVLSILLVAFCLGCTEKGVKKSTQAEAVPKEEPVLMSGGEAVLPIPDSVIVPVHVNYDLSLEEMIAKVPSIAQRSPDLTAENFPIVPREDECEVDIHLYRVDKLLEDMVPDPSMDSLVETWVLLDAFLSKGLRPAELPELLALGDTVLEAGYTVTALGSTWLDPDEHRYSRQIVPELTPYEDGTMLLGMRATYARWPIYTECCSIRWFAGVPINK